METVALHITFCTFSLKYIYILVHHPNQKKMTCRIISNKKPIQSFFSPSSLTFSSFVLMLYCTCTSVFWFTYVVIPPHTHITGLISAYGIEHIFSGFNSTFISVYTVMLSKDCCLNYLCSCEFPFFFFLSLFF